jgi:hypothetical protein
MRTDFKTSSHLRMVKAPRRVPCPMVGHLKHSFFGLSQPKNECFEPAWGPEIFACGNLNEHTPNTTWLSASPVDIGICAAELGPHPRLFLASAHCPSGRRQCRFPGKPVRVCARRSSSGAGTNVALTTHERMTGLLCRRRHEHGLPADDHRSDRQLGTQPRNEQSQCASNAPRDRPVR